MRTLLRDNEKREAVFHVVGNFPSCAPGTSQLCQKQYPGLLTTLEAARYPSTLSTKLLDTSSTAHHRRPGRRTAFSMYDAAAGACGIAFAVYM
jgi:hypothetical protein